MEFWSKFLDPTKNRKVKGFMLATFMRLADKISGEQWVMCFAIYVAGAAAEKIAKMKKQ